LDTNYVRTHPEEYTVLWGVFAFGEGTVQDTQIYLPGHWILDEGFNGRAPLRVSTRGGTKTTFFTVIDSKQADEGFVTIEGERYPITEVHQL
jgi:hypothetical protein